MVQCGAIDHVLPYYLSSDVVLLFFSNCTTHVVSPLCLDHTCIECTYC